MIGSERHCICFNPLTVQRLLVISLLALHLFGNTEMSQLVSIPRIFEHYQYHHLQPQHEDLSFASFVWMHYIGTDGDVNDDTQDNQLPFLHFTHPSSLVAVSPPSTFSGSQPVSCYHSNELGYHNNDNILKDFTKGLLRPPCLG